MSLFPGILALYGKDFIAAWTAAINNLQLKPLLNDKPKYLKLSAASAPTSPILTIFESIRDETALTRERPKPQVQGAAATDQAKQDALAMAQSRLGTAGREAIDLAMKSQREAGRPAGRESRARRSKPISSPSRSWSTASPDLGPIDNLLANLNELYRQLTLAA